MVGPVLVVCCMQSLCFELSSAILLLLSNTDTLLESIRLKNFLDEIGLKGEELEDFARHLDIHCFKRGLTPDTFMNLVANISSLSDSLGVPVEELPRSINSSKELLDDFNLGIKNHLARIGWAD
jgi:hypothetical protein